MRLILIMLSFVLIGVDVSYARDTAAPRTAVTPHRHEASWALLGQVNGPSIGYLLQENGGRLILDPRTSSRTQATIRSPAQ